jgi:O-antigen/teichoic acid export membrane protein
MKTKLVPLVTLASAVLNVAINLIWVPRYGVMTAAVSTAISYAVSAGLHALLAHKLHPIPWEYRRWAHLMGVAALCYALGSMLPVRGLVVGVTLKTLIATALYVMALTVTGFFSHDEIARARRFAARKYRRV